MYHDQGTSLGETADITAAAATARQNVQNAVPKIIQTAESNGWTEEAAIAWAQEIVNRVDDAIKYSTTQSPDQLIAATNSIIQQQGIYHVSFPPGKVPTGEASAQVALPGQITYAADDASKAAILAGQTTLFNQQNPDQAGTATPEQVQDWYAQQQEQAQQQQNKALTTAYAYNQTQEATQQQQAFLQKQLSDKLENILNQLKIKVLNAAIQFGLSVNDAQTATATAVNQVRTALNSAANTYGLTQQEIYDKAFAVANSINSNPTEYIKNEYTSKTELKKTVNEPIVTELITGDTQSQAVTLNSTPVAGCFLDFVSSNTVEKNEYLWINYTTQEYGVIPKIPGTATPIPKGAFQVTMIQYKNYVDGLKKKVATEQYFTDQAAVNAKQVEETKAAQASAQVAAAAANEALKAAQDAGLDVDSQLAASKAASDHVQAAIDAANAVNADSITVYNAAVSAKNQAVTSIKSGTATGTTAATTGTSNITDTIKKYWYLAAAAGLLLIVSAGGKK